MTSTTEWPDHKIIVEERLDRSSGAGSQETHGNADQRLLVLRKVSGWAKSS